MHDHDDPKHCTLCSSRLTEMESYLAKLTRRPVAPVENISTAVQRYAEAAR